jgi:hypothetical protein
MGILDFLLDLGLSDECKYNFNKLMDNFKCRYPDVDVYRQHNLKPCPFYLFYIDKKANRFAEFFRSAISRDLRMNDLKKIEGDQAIVWHSMTYYSNSGGIYFPNQ